MAINFLNSIDLNRNEIQDAQLIRAQVENQVNDGAVGGTPVEGQLYFNTTSDVLKVYANSAWVEVGGGVISLTLNDGTYIDVNSSGTAANPVFTPNLNAVDGTSIAGTRFLSKDNTWDVPTYPSDANTTYELFGVGSTNGTAGIQLDGSDDTLDNVLIIGAGTTTVTRSVNTLTVTSNDQYDGTVTSVAQTHAGNAFSVTGTPISGSGTLAIGVVGTAAQYITGQGNLATFPSIPTVSNATITLAAGNGLATGGAFTLNQSANETITFDLATGGIGAGTIGSASDSIKIDTITVDAYGRITAATTGATGQVNTVVSSNTNTLTATGTINKTLTAVTGAVVNAGTALATGDQIYDFVTAQIANVPSGLSFEGSWNASTDTPSLAGTTPANGVFYIVSVAGTTSLSGITDWEVGDWAVYVSDGAGTDAWQKIDNTSTLSGSGATNQVTYWTGSANVAGDTGMTYDATGNVLTVGGGTSTEWDAGYDNSITALAVTGTTTKTLTATQQDGGTLTASWTDNDSGGTVTNIATAGPITGGPITSTGTIGITTASTGVIGAGAVAASTGISVAYSSGIATITNTNTNATNTFTNTGPAAAGTSYTISSATHGLGTNSAIIMVQLVEVSTGETVFADVVRGASGLITITFAASQAINTFRALLQKIG